MLFELKDAWILISEAGLDGSYPACHVDNRGTGGAYKIRFPEAQESVYPDISG